ncbi:MAG: chitobiase/beta-hexosaminidase C-terminal domain-containing protein [Candidatus Didemnitutus sp.]|nr:chitobiase/beta-hexosaminidase C-terminal domain-containing protein [Candidatus Didemnitutus sp.]
MATALSAPALFSRAVPESARAKPSDLAAPIRWLAGVPLAGWAQRLLQRLGWLSMGLLLGFVAAPLQAEPTQSIAVGNGHTLVVRSDGTLWTLGAGEFGQLGDGTFSDRNQPQQIAAGVKSVAAGAFHSLFIKDDGTLWGMGTNFEGQLGLGENVNGTATPVQVAQNVLTMAAGYQHTLYLKTDGTLWAMGRNTEGQLGDGTRITRFTPVQVASGVVALAAGLLHSTFIKTNGTLWAAGWNYYGQLGDGTTIDRTAPVQIATDVTQVAAGYSHTVFVKSNRTAWGAGFNDYGQIGAGTIERRFSPVQVATDVVKLGCGSIHTLALKSDGSLWATGWNGNGQLGTGNFDSQLSFVKVATGVLDIATFGYTWHSLFQKTDYSVWGMGNNFNGQLGPRATSLPTPVLLFASPLGAPEFIQQPAAATVLGGLATTFSASADGDPAPALQWQRLAAGATDWVDLANDNTFAGVTTATLTIDPALPAMSGDAFRCVATNLVGTAVSESAALTVLHPLPAPTIEPASGVVPLGQLITLGIDASGVELRYTTDGSEPTESSTLYAAPFAIDPPLTLKVKGFKEGQPPSPTASAVFEQLLPPAIVFQTESRTFRRGSTVTLTAIATGGNLSYQWFEGAKGDTSKPVAGAVSNVLVRSELLASTSYWLRVSNAAGQADSETIDLTLNLLPLDNWADTSPPQTSTIRGLAIGGSGVPPQVIAVGQIRSIYGINASLVEQPEFWILRLADNSNFTLTSVIWTGTRFVATGRNGDWYTSTNGAQWTIHLNGNVFSLVNSIAAAGTTFIAVGDGGGIYRSTNITNTSGWTDHSLTGDIALYSIIWTGSQFVTVGGSSSTGTAIFTSASGTSWTRQAQGLSTATLRSVIYGGEQYVAVGANGTVATSPDAITWTLRNSGVTAELKSVAWSGRTYLAVGANGAIISSPNGIDWTTRYSGITTGLETVVWEPNYEHFVTAGAMGRVLVTSDDPPGPPAILAQPPPRTIGLNQTATLQVTASGSGLTYQWYQGISGDTRTPLAGKTTRTLVTAALTADTQFWVRVSNSGGATDSNTATVTVVPPPEISVHPLSRAVTLGAAVELTGAATGAGSLAYQWQRKPLGSETWSNLTNVAPFSGTGTTTLTIAAVNAAIAGDSFRLVATNLGGSAFSQAATITANQPPQFTLHPADATGLARQPLTFTVQVEGFPSPALEWQFRANSTSAWVRLEDGADISGTSTATLTFAAPSGALDGAQVRSVAFNDVGFVASNSATLDIARLSQTITFNALADRALSDGSFSLVATADSGLPVLFASSNPAVATVNGSVVTLVGPGSTVITATQAGDSDWLPAAAVPRTLSVVNSSSGVSFADWAADLGLTGEDALPDATPFADGLPNLVRYAMNLDAEPLPSHLPAVSTLSIEGATHVALEYRQRKDAGGVMLIPEWSVDLETWTAVGANEITALADDDGETARCRVAVPLDANARVFLRLRAMNSP